MAPGQTVASAVQPQCNVNCITPWATFRCGTIYKVYVLFMNASPCEWLHAHGELRSWDAPTLCTLELVRPRLYLGPAQLYCLSMRWSELIVFAHRKFPWVRSGITLESILSAYMHTEGQCCVPATRFANKCH